MPFDLAMVRLSCFLQISGEPSRTRTCDPLVKSQLLYRLSYRPTNSNSLKFQVSSFKLTDLRLLTPSPFGRGLGGRDKVSGGNQKPSTPSLLSSNLVLTSELESKQL